MSSRSSRSKLVFYLILAALGLSSLYLIRAYLGLFFLAVVITMVFDPLYQWLVRHLKRSTLASILTTLFVIFLVLLPLVVVVALAITQAVFYFNTFSKSFDLNNPVIQYLLASANQLYQSPLTNINLTNLNRDSNLINLISGSITVIGTFLIKNILPIISLSIQAIAQTVFFFVFIVYLFPYRDKMFAALEKITPINPLDHRRFFDRFEAVTVSTMKSMVIIGFAQGFLGGLMLSLLNFPAAAFWGLVMAITSVIPLGSGIIWIPISIYMLFSGQWVQALILFAWGTFVISTVDNVIRAKLLSIGKAKLPEILTLLSVLGGLNTFGFWGFIYGPAIVGLFYTGVTIYSENQKKS